MGFRSRKDKDLTPKEFVEGANKTEEEMESQKVKNFNLINISKQTLASNHLVRAQKSILFNHYEQIKKWRKTQKEDLFLDLNIDKRREKKGKSNIGN